MTRPGSRAPGPEPGLGNPGRGRRDTARPGRRGPAPPRAEQLWEGEALRGKKAVGNQQNWVLMGFARIGQKSN